MREPNDWKLFISVPTGDGENSSTMAFLQCQKFVELVAEGELDRALEYAREILVHLLDRPEEKSHLEEVIALLAYEDIEQSPVAPLLSISQREKTADAVNHAILGLVQDQEQMR